MYFIYDIDYDVTPNCGATSSRDVTGKAKQGVINSEDCSHRRGEIHVFGVSDQ